MNIERNESFSRQFQDTMMAHVVRHPRLLSLAVRGKFKEEDWDLPIQRAVLKAALQVVKVHQGNSSIPIHEGELMSELMVMVRVGGITQNEVPALAGLVALVYSTPLSPDYYYGMAEQFIHHQRTHATLNATTKLTIDQLHINLSKVALDSKVQDEEPIIPLREIQMGLPTMCVPTGISSIDIPMNGGLPLGEIGMICAFTGVGKSTLGANFLWGGANLGFQTRMATLELTGKKFSQRLYANIADIDYSKILYGDGSGSQEAYLEVTDEITRKVNANCQGRQDNLQIWDFSKKRCTIGTLKDWLHRDQDRQAQKNLTPPQMLFLDWLLLLDEEPGFDPRKLSDKETRHKIQRHMNELAEMVATENIALWVATQADQKAEGKAIVTIANAAEAKSSAWRVFLFAGVGMSPEDREAKPPKATFYAAKARDLRQFKCELLSQLDKQRFGDYPIAQQNDEASDACGVTSDLIAAQGRGMTPAPTTA